MASAPPPEDRDPLSNLMGEWKLAQSLPPGFQDDVWRRIERARAAEAPISSIWTALVHWLSSALSRPMVATSYLTVLLGLGITIGWTSARQETTRVKNELGERYVRVLDPYLTPRQ
jgi:hypothetical protein